MTRSNRAGSQSGKGVFEPVGTGAAGVTRTGTAQGRSGAPGRHYGPAVRAKLALELSDDLVDAVAERVADLLAQGSQPEPWIGLDEAAEHLGCPVSRLYRLRARADGGRERNPLPFERDGARLLFRRSALDLWVQNGGADS
jgi:hypothetical protein